MTHANGKERQRGHLTHPAVKLCDLVPNRLFDIEHNAGAGQPSGAASDQAGRHGAASRAGWTHAVCAAEQTASMRWSRLQLNLEASGTVCRMCFAELARRRDRVGSGWRCGRPMAGGNYVNQQPGNRTTNRVHSMLYTIAVILLVLWLLGLVTSYTLGGFIHILLVFAVVMVLVNLITGRRAL